MTKRKFSICLILVLISSIMFGTVSFNATKRPTISKTSTSIYVGSTTTIKVKNASKTVKWSSSNSSVAKIIKKSGNHNFKVTVKGVKKGSATITAKVGNKSLKCRVTVKTKSKPRPALVYITPTGQKYHSTKNCPTLSRSKTISAISLAEAKSRGYDPCKVCH